MSASAVTRCVLLNGPAGCGKDTLADLLSEYGFAKHQFKESLYQETANHYGLSLPVVRFLCTNRDTKEMPCHIFQGRTPRQALIHVSEDCIKPIRGLSYFGEQAVLRCRDNNDRAVVFSDSGFVDETIPCINHFDHVLILRMHRTGYSFDGDSRNYLPDLPNADSMDVQVEEGDPGKPIDAILDWAYRVGLIESVGAHRASQGPCTA